MASLCWATRTFVAVASLCLTGAQAVCDPGFSNDEDCFGTGEVVAIFNNYIDTTNTKNELATGLPLDRQGCAADSSEGLIFYTTREAGKDPVLYSYEVGHYGTPPPPQKLATIKVGKGRIAGLAIDITKGNLFVSYVDTAKGSFSVLMHKTYRDTTSVRTLTSADEVFAMSGGTDSGGSVVIVQRDLYMLHPATAGATVSKHDLDDTSASWEELAFLAGKLPGEPLGMSGSETTLFVTSVQLATYPGDLHRIDLAASKVESFSGIVYENPNQPAVSSVPDDARAVALARWDQPTRNEPGYGGFLVYGFSPLSGTPDLDSKSTTNPSSIKKVKQAGRTQYGLDPGMGPICWMIKTDCQSNPCPTDQHCRDPDMIVNNEYECHCLLPKIGPVVKNGPAVCQDGGDCKDLPCGFEQLCTDDDATKNGKWGCACVAPQVGADVANGKAKCQAGGGDDCAKNPCDPKQTCKDTDMIENMMYTCDCVAPQTGPTGNGANATCTDPPDDCEPKPCGMDQTCKDDGNKDDLYSCECIPPQTGAPVMKGLAMCISPPDDCEAKPCGMNQTCKDDGNKDDTYTCECAPPKTGAPGMNGMATCADPDNDCASNSCGVGQTCADPDNTKNTAFTCTCDPPTTGTPAMNTSATCMAASGDCDNAPCGADQTCNEGTPGDMAFECTCADGTPDVGVSKPAVCLGPDCVAKPCGANQRCTDDGAKNDKFSCECVVGTGKADDAPAVCAENDCTAGPCGPDQDCTDETGKDGSFFCRCKDPLSGLGRSRQATCTEAAAPPVTPAPEDAPITGVVIAAIGGLILCFVLAFLFFHYKRRQQPSAHPVDEEMFHMPLNEKPERQPPATAQRQAAAPPPQVFTRDSVEEEPELLPTHRTDPTEESLGDSLSSIEAAPFLPVVHGTIIKAEGSPATSPRGSPRAVAGSQSAFSQPPTPSASAVSPLALQPAVSEAASAPAVTPTAGGRAPSGTTLKAEGSSSGATGSPLVTGSPTGTFGQGKHHPYRGGFKRGPLPARDSAISPDDV